MMNKTTDKNGLPRIIVITGPTASGKTGASIALARRLGGEIVSADSMQIYRGLDIGTAKPTMEERSGVIHHLIDIVDIDEHYHVGRYLVDATEAIGDITARDKVVLVVGGTALYIKVLLEGLAPGPGRDEKVRGELEESWEGGGAASLWSELEEADPVAAEKLHPNDRSRIIRALEVWRATGKPLSALQAEHGFKEKKFNALILGMDVGRDLLYRRINARVDAMFAQGWPGEVRSMLDRGYSPELSPLSAIGYRQLCGYISGSRGEGGDLEGVKEEIRAQTRRFAKRQMTWFRKMEITWVEPGAEELIYEKAKNFLQ